MENPDSVIELSALQQMLEDTGGDPEFVVEIIDDFLANGAELIENLQNSIATHDLNTARRAAHSLKGNSASLGAIRLSQLSAEIEVLCIEDRVPETSRRLPELAAAFSQVQIALTAEQERMQE